MITIINNMKNLENLPKYIDNRGVIQMILESCEIGSISRIVSTKGSFRANHWHKNDSHFIEVLAGQVELYEQAIGSTTKPILKIVNVGDIAFTDKQIMHTMYFPVNTVFNCYSRLPRDSKNYEEDTIRFNQNLKEVYNGWKN